MNNNIIIDGPLFYTMFNPWFLISLFLFTVICFFEILVFNEEILLALCFFSFIFFCFNSLGSSVFETFQERGAKFEEDLLTSYNLSKQTIGIEASNDNASRGFVSKFSTVLVCVTNYVNTLTKYLSYKYFSSFVVTCYAKLGELAAFETKIISDFQQGCVSLLLYPLIFQTSENNLVFLTEPTTSENNNMLWKVSALVSISK